MSTLDLRRKVMKGAVREAGLLLRDYFGKDLGVRKKGELDLVTRADEAAERIVLDHIGQSFPQDAILAEESGSRSGNSPYQWIVDPLDGTTNFAHGFPHFSVSVALAEEDRVLSGIIFDPMKDEWFEAHAGEGATLNGQPIRVGARTRIDEALSVTGFSYDRRTRLPVLLERVRRLLQYCQGLRRLGSAALDLAYIACGRFDVFIEDGLQPWDIAAGQLIVTEAGGVVSLFDGSALNLARGEILASNPALAREALSLLTPPLARNGNPSC